MNLPPYPKYRPSGVEWIGDVPEHWEVRRLRSTTENVIDQTNQKSDWEIYIALEHIESWTGRIHEYDSDVVFESQVKKFRCNDVLFGKLRPYLAKITRPSTDGVCVGEFLVLRPRNDELMPNYLEYLLRSKPMIDLISASTFGAKMPRTDWQFIGELLHPHPPLSEQTSVSDFLDRKTEKIKTLIDKNQVLVERLKEKRAALITHTVICGLPPDAARAAGFDPYPKFKSSSVEWIGDVPKHWKVKRLKNVATYWMSNVDKISRDNERPVHLCNYTDVYYHDHIDGDMDLMQSTATSDEIDRFGLQTGDIVITKDSEDWTDIAVPALVTETAPDLVCGYHLAIIRRMKLILDSHFAFRLLQSRSVNQQFQVAATGVTRYGIPKSSIGEARLPVPPLSEQRAIADFVDRETERVDDLIVKTEAAIERLREYRSAIIDAAVTGRIDTRTADTPEGEPSNGSSQREDLT